MKKVNEIEVTGKNDELFVQVPDQGNIELNQFCLQLEQSPPSEESLKIERKILSFLGEQFYFYSGKEPTLELPSHYGKELQAQGQEMTFFPGTFDPLHDGHVECLTRCPERNVIVMPDHNPWKEDQKRNSSPLRTYLDLIHVLKDTPYKVFPGFLGLDHVNPTVDWLPGVHLEKKKLLMGADTFMAMEKWKDPTKLFSSLDQLYVLGRKVNIEHLETRARVLKQSHPNLKIEIFPDNPHEDLSSSKIRELH